MVKVRYSSELYHHGILGQKWGIRRYQNQDGSLTPEGRIRYRKGYAKYGNRSIVSNGRTWGGNSKSNVLFITGEPNTGKSTFANDLLNGKVKGFESYNRRSQLIRLDGYTEKTNSDLRNLDFDDFLKKNGYNPETLYRSNRTDRDFDTFTDLLEKYGQECYKNNYGVVAEGRQLLDNTFYPNKKQLKTKPVILLTENPFNPYKKNRSTDEQRMLDSWK